MLVAINNISHWNTAAIILAFQRIFSHTTHNLFRKFSRVKFRISL